MEWYLKVLQNYVVFEGRARRKEYWMFVLINVLISIAIGILEAVLDLPKFISTVYSLAILLPTIAVGVRRLHDTGRSGWWLLLNFIPIIGGIVLLIFMCQDSQYDENQYGPNPKAVVL